MKVEELGELAKKVVVSVEHGWLCFRTVEQKLLLGLEASDPRVARGVKLEELADELEAGFEEVRRRKEMSEGAGR